MITLALDGNGEVFQLPPCGPALARTVDATISAATAIDLNADTSYIEVYAIAKDVYLKWGTTNVSASNFDVVIPAGQVRYLPVPTGYGDITVIEREASATVIVIER